MNRSRLIPLALLSAIATACGGGGGGSEPPPTLTVTPSARTVETGENSSSQVVISASYTGSDEVSYDLLANGSDLVSTTLNENILTVSVGDMDERDQEITVSVHVAAGELSETIEISVNAVNTSANELLAWGDTVTAHATSISQLTEFSTLVDFYANSAFYLGRISAPEKALVVQASSSEQSVLEEYLEHLSAALNSFRTDNIDWNFSGGHAKESDISAAKQNVVEAAEVAATARITSINALVNSAALPLPSLPSPKLMVDPHQGSASFLIGNPDYGQFNLLGNWEFSGEYAQLDPIFDNNQCTQ